jgi:phage protein D
MKIKDKMDLVQQESLHLNDENGNPIEVPKEGALGIIALGYKGIVAWKKNREL